MHLLNRHYRELCADETGFRRLTGLRVSEFEALHEPFAKAWIDYFANYTLEGQARYRKASMRKNSIFTDTRDALLFALLYYKGNVLQEELATQFDIDQPKASKYLHLISKLLARTLQENAKVLPKVKIDRLKQVIIIN